MHLDSSSSDFSMGGPHAVRVGRHSSSILSLKTGAPQGCALSIKFADDTVVVGLITDKIKNAFPEGSRGLDPLVSEQPTPERQQGVDSGLWEEVGRELPLILMGPRWGVWTASNTLVSTSLRA